MQPYWFDQDFVIIPLLANGNHWIASVVNIKKKCIIFGDSHCESQNDIVSQVIRFLCMGMYLRNGCAFHAKSWTHVDSNK